MMQRNEGGARYGRMAALLFFLVAGCAGGPPPGGGRETYAYNYPHAVPPDYAYRTGRVFGPPEGPVSRFAKSAGAGAGAFLPGRGFFSDRRSAALVAKTGELAAALLRNGGSGIGDDYAFTVSTFVSLGSLYRTSSFGRFLGEQLIADLQHAGIEVVEVRKTEGLLVKEGFGEYGLSRDMNELNYIHEAQARVTGTYTVSGDKVFVSARILRNSDGAVLSAANLVFDRDALVADLLADEDEPVAAATTEPASVRVRAY